MKKVISLLLTLMLIISVLTVPATVFADTNTSVGQVYSDVSTAFWAYDAINRVSAKNWFNGYPDGTFLPNNSITRAEALKVFAVFLSLDVIPVTQTSYYDVQPTDWYAPYIEAGKDLFPVHTTIQGKTPFQPNMPVTREDTVYALVKALGYDVNVTIVDQSVLNMFTDANSISASIKPYAAIAVNKGLVAGFEDGTFRAQDPLTRAQFATLLERASNIGFNDAYTAKISGVTVSPANMEMILGESAVLTARANYTNGTSEAYSELAPYVSGTTGIVALSGNTVTALKAGTTTISFNSEYLKNTTVTVTVKNPTDAPVLRITDYPDETEEESVTVSGKVTDANIATLLLSCNGKDVLVNSDGTFSTKVTLKEGDNAFTFTVENQYKVKTEKSISIYLQKKNEVVSEWVVRSAVPAGATVVASKYAYDVVTKTTSNQPTMSGWTLYDTKSQWGDYGTWSEWSGDLVEASDAREVEQRTIPAVTKTQYNYSRYLNSKGTWSGPWEGYWNDNYCNVYSEHGWIDSQLHAYEYGRQYHNGVLENYTCYKDGSKYWYNETTRQVEITPAHTEYRYRNRSLIYTYYFEKTEAKESLSYPAEVGAENIVEWVRYITK